MTLPPEFWTLIPRDTSLANIEITEDQALFILKQWKSAPNASLMGKKPDGTEFLREVVNRNDWKITKGTGKKEDRSGDTWVCDWGTRHGFVVGVHTDPATGKLSWSALDCGCIEKLNVPSTIFQDWCRKFYKIETAADITKDMQREYLKKNAI